MSSFLNISVLVLATMVLVLAGMVGYLYWQQNKLMRALSSLSGFVQTLIPPVIEHEPEPQAEAEAEAVAEDEESDSEDETEDDRVSVEHVDTEQKIEVPQVPLVEEDEDVETKTAVQLRELLNKRGIPFGKRDSKNVLIQLLKASS